MLETLHNIRSDLEKTAEHLESLSQAMTGHLLYLNKRGGHVDGIDVKGHIASINSSAEVLRTVASKMDEDWACELPEPVDICLNSAARVDLQTV